MKIKKILIILLLSLFITGCYDYNEVNNLNIVTGIGIDYQDNEYIITLEILNNAGDKNAVKLDSILVNGHGNTISTALENATNELSKTPNYTHLNVLVLSENALKDNWFSIMDFFLRSTEFRENFYVVTTNNNKPEDILNTKTVQNKVASSLIRTLFDNQKYNTINKQFEEYAEDHTTFNKNLIFTNVDIKNNNIIIDGALALSNKTYYLNNNYVQLYNLINNNENRIMLNNDDLSVEATNSKLSIDIKNGTITISGFINSKILNNNSNINLKDLNSINNLNNEFKQAIEKEIKNLIIYLQDNSLDIFGLDNKYYQHTRRKYNNYWINLDTNLNIDFKINKKGLTYEVEYEK